MKRWYWRLIWTLAYAGTRAWLSEVPHDAVYAHPQGSAR
jgi:hypothetical protein